MMVLPDKKDRSVTDPNGTAVLAYLSALEVLKDGEWIERDPPPEVLSGDPRVVAAAIAATPYAHSYFSAVASFHQDDIPVEKVLARDRASWAMINRFMGEFPEVAFAGVPREEWPPYLWVAHWHTGRLELNFLCPKMIMFENGEVRAFNPHPPGPKSRKLWNAFEDKWNFEMGWADPRDPARRRIVKAPDHILKQSAEAKRFGKEYRNVKLDLMLSAEREFLEGRFTCRAEVIDWFLQAGWRVNRVGEDYFTLVDEVGEKHRLKGLLFSAAFTSREALLSLKKSKSRKTAEQAAVEYGAAYADWRDGIVKKYRAARLKEGRGRPVEFEPLVAPSGEEVAAWNAGRSLPTVPRDHAASMECVVRNVGNDLNDPMAGSDEMLRCIRLSTRVRPLIPKGLYDRVLWTVPSRITLVDPAAQKGVVHIRDEGERLTTSQVTEDAALLMAALARAKGWSAVRLKGSAEFQRHAAVALAKMHIELITDDEGVAALYRQTWTKENERLRHEKDERNPERRQDPARAHHDTLGARADRRGQGDEQFEPGHSPKVG